jgi:hypothetical protein
MKITDLAPFKTAEDYMMGNARIGILKRTVTRKPVRAGKAAERLNDLEHRAKLAEIGRRYTLQVKVIDPDGREILNLTKLTLERDLPGKVKTTPEIRDVLELLVEATGEWCA